MSIKKETIKVKAPKEEIKKVKAPKRVIPVDIEKEFELIFAKLKVQLNEKKYTNRLKKAIKVLTHGLEKKKVVKKEVVKKKAEKPAKAVVKTKKSAAVKKITKKG